MFAYVDENGNLSSKPVDQGLSAINVRIASIFVNTNKRKFMKIEKSHSCAGCFWE